MCNWFVFITDVQKFPLRMKDNDLLVTELYRDPSEDAITALSVYLTPKTSKRDTCTQKEALYPTQDVGYEEWCSDTSIPVQTFNFRLTI